LLKKSLVLVGLLFVGSCSYSGNIIQREVPGTSGTVPYRGGTVPYRNDAKASARRDDAVRKIAKFCSSENYSITREGASSSAPDMSEVEFQCGPPPTAPAAAVGPTQSKSTNAPTGSQ
jgi:hypothetical protein